MPGRAGEQIDHQDAHHDQPRAEHGRHVEGLTVEDPARQGDQDDADPRPDRIGDADRDRPQGEGQAIERQPVDVMTTSDGRNGDCSSEYSNYLHVYTDNIE